MKLFFYAVLFFLGYTFQAGAQQNTNYPQWQHPVLQQLRAGSKTLIPFYNKDSTRFVTVSVIDNKQKIIYWFDCYGYYFDAVPIGDINLQAVVKKNITAFTYYAFLTTDYLKKIAAARSNLQTNGNAAKFTADEKHLLQIDDSIKYPSSLKKLIELDKQKLSVERQIREFFSITPHKIKWDTLFSRTIVLPYGSMQTTWEQEDTLTTYYNRLAVEPVYKAILNHQGATITYFNRGGQLIDEVPINKGKISLLFTEKTDVFLLYRGWLEMQRFNSIESLRNIKSSAKEFTKAHKNISAAKVVNKKSSYQSLLAYTKQLLKITDYKINYLTTIDRNFVSQCLRNQYQQISNTLSAEQGRLSAFARGNKYYELPDARGNVMAVVTDKKIQRSSNGTTIDSYEPDIASATDYAPFGGALPGRSYQPDKYRYGFNGKENDNEVNQQDYGMRIYDPRLGRFLSVDPIAKDYPELTPYQFASNTPIQAIDLDGLEAAGVGGGVSTTQLQSTTAGDQTGKGFIAMGKGFVSSVKNTAKGVWNAIKDPKKAGKNS